MQLVVHIWELDVDTGRPSTEHPTLSHVFYGKDRTEVDDLCSAHVETDEFFGGALEDGRWEDIPLAYRGFYLGDRGEQLGEFRHEAA